VENTLPLKEKQKASCKST